MIASVGNLLLFELNLENASVYTHVLTQQYRKLLYKLAFMSTTVILKLKEAIANQLVYTK